VIFSMIHSEAAELEKRKASGVKTEGDFKVHYRISTSFSDEEAAQVLAAMQIETPHDEGKVLRVAVVRKPIDDPPADP